MGSKQHMSIFPMLAQIDWKSAMSFGVDGARSRSISLQLAVGLFGMKLTSLAVKVSNTKDIDVAA